MKKAADETALFSRNEVKNAESKQLKEMESKGAKINRPNIEPFRAAVQPVYAKAKEAYGQDVDQLLAEAAAIRKALPAK